MAYRNRGRGGGYGSGGFGYQEEYETEDFGYGGDNQWNQGIQTNRKRRNNFDQLQQFEQRNDNWGEQPDSWGSHNDSYDESYERDWHGGNGDRLRRNPNPPGSQWPRQDNYTFDDYNDGGVSNSRKRVREDYGNSGFSAYPKRGRDEFNDRGFSNSQKRGRFRDDPPPRRRDPHSVNFYDDYEEPYSRPDRSRRPLRRPDDHRPPRDRGTRTREERRSNERRRTESSRRDDRDRSHGSRSNYRRSTSDSHSRRNRGSHSEGNQRKKSAVEEAIYEKHRLVTVEKERRNRIGDTMQGLLLAFRAVAQILASEDDKSTNENKTDTKTTDNGKMETDVVKAEESTAKLENATETTEDASVKTDDHKDAGKDEKKPDEETKTDDAVEAPQGAEEKMLEDEPKEVSKDVAQEAVEQSSENAGKSTEQKDTDTNEVEDDKEKDMDDLTEDYKVIDEVADNDQPEETNPPTDDTSSINDKRTRSGRGKIKTSTSQSSRRKATELVYESKDKKKGCEPVLLGAIKCGEAAMRMLVGDQVEGMVVVLSKKKPTRSLVERIKGLILQSFLKDSRMVNEKFTLEFDEENECMLLTQESLSGFRVLIRFTSPQCSPDYDGKVEENDPSDVLSPESCRVALTMIRRMRFVVKQLDPSAAALTVVRVLLYFRTIEEWSKMPVWLVLVLVHVSIETAKKAYDKSDSRDFLRVDKVFIRCIEILSSGVLLPTGEGLKDPCEADSDVGACLAPQDAEDITLAAQTAMRLIEFGKMRDVLGLPKNDKEEKEKENKGEKVKEEKQKEKEKEKEEKEKKE